MTLPAQPTLTLPARVPESFRAALTAATEAWTSLLGPRLVSLVLFGSVARGQAGTRWDIDVCVTGDRAAQRGGAGPGRAVG